MATMPKNPNWLKKKDEPRCRPATLPDYAADLKAGPSRQVRRRAAAVLVAQEASADRAMILAMKKAVVKPRQALRQAAAVKVMAEIVEVAA